MVNVVQVWRGRTRIQAHVRQNAEDPAAYTLTCIEVLNGGEYNEAVTSEQTYGNYEGCLTSALAWAGHPHSAIVWDHVHGMAYDPNGGAA